MVLDDGAASMKHGHLVEVVGEGLVLMIDVHDVVASDVCFISLTFENCEQTVVATQSVFREGFARLGRTSKGIQSTAITPTAPSLAKERQESCELRVWETVVECHLRFPSLASTPLGRRLGAR